MSGFWAQKQSKKTKKAKKGKEEDDEETEDEEPEYEVEKVVATRKKVQRTQSNSSKLLMG